MPTVRQQTIGCDAEACLSEFVAREGIFGSVVLAAPIGFSQRLDISEVFSVRMLIRRWSMNLCVEVSTPSKFVCRLIPINRLRVQMTSIRSPKSL